MKVSNMQSRKGNDVPNQFEMIDNFGVKYFQSYKSIIAKIEHLREGLGTRITLDEYYWNYSRTTSKYLSMFLNECTGDIKKKIEDGVYLLANLN